MHIGSRFPQIQLPFHFLDTTLLRYITKPSPDSEISRNTWREGLEAANEAPQQWGRCEFGADCTLHRKQSGVTVRGRASFADLNNEGVLDFFSHYHFQMLPETDWDVGVSAVNDANEMTIRASVSSQSCRLEFLTQIGGSYRVIFMGQLLWTLTATAC